MYPCHESRMVGDRTTTLKWTEAGCLIFLWVFSTKLGYTLLGQCTMCTSTAAGFPLNASSMNASMCAWSIRFFAYAIALLQGYGPRCRKFTGGNCFELQLISELFVPFGLSERSRNTWQEGWNFNICITDNGRQKITLQATFSSVHFLKVGSRN